MGKYGEKAVKLHDEKYNCCQSVLCAACARCNLEEQTAFHLGAFFGSGMRRGEVCGCVSGALMAIGMQFGDEQNRESKASVQFLREFEHKYGALRCRELLEKNGKPICPELIAFVSEYLEEHL